MTNNKDMCSLCMQEREMTIVWADETLKIHGKSVTYKSEFTKCTVCGDEYLAPGQMDRNLQAAREAYDRLYGTPTSDELRALRGRYDISQKAMGLLLGFGELTMNTYESGASQPQPANRLLLKLAANPMVFKEIYAINKEKISALQRKRVEESEGYREAINIPSHPYSLPEIQPAALGAPFQYQSSSHGQWLVLASKPEETAEIEVAA